MRLALAALLCLVAAPAWAAGKVQYGSRAGMEVTVRRVAGIGTAHAQIFTEHTPADAKKFCVDYSDDHSEKCVQDTLRETHLNDVLEGDCVSGRFTSLFGERMRFMGKNRRKKSNDPLSDEPTNLLIGSDGRPLSPDNASGYFVNLEQFKALCPTRVFEIE